MGKKSAGILLYREEKSVLQILLVHPGGPFWAKKDAGTWSMPKGEYEGGEDALAAAKREFEEELGKKVDANSFVELPPVKSKSNKTVIAFAAEGNFDTTTIVSNLIWIDWPPRSGKRMQIPEVDRAEWFSVDVAREKITAYQSSLIDHLLKAIG